MKSVMIAPQYDLLGPGQRAILICTEGKVQNGVQNYRKFPERWTNVGQMRMRDHADVAKGHYWQVVCLDPEFTSLTEDLEHAMAGAMYTIEPAPSVLDMEPSGP